MSIKKVMTMFAFFTGIACATYAQGVSNDSTATAKAEGLKLTKEVYPQTEEDGDLYHGLTKKLMFDRMIPPHGLEVTYDKTVHILFPSAVRYVDLGSPNLIAGKADGAENVIRVKATVRNFRTETNMSVITEDGSYYSFNVKYADEPLMLNVEMKDFIHDGSAVNRPNNAQEIYLKELGSESPMLVHLIMKSLHKENKRKVKHIGCKRFGIQYLLKGIYVHNDLLYLHTEVKNQSNVPFDVDYITFKIVDINPFQQVLDAETLAADVLHLALVLLVQRLHDEVYQHRAFAAQFLQVDFLRVVRSVHRAAVVDKVLHLHVQDKRLVGCKRFGIQYLLKGIYVHNDLLYFHTEIKNQSNVPFDVDYITFKIVDKKVAKRTAMQEQVLFPLRAYNYAVRVAGKQSERTVFCLPKFTIPDGKQLVVEMNEKDGGRHQTFTVENEDLVQAETINELRVR